MIYTTPIRLIEVFGTEHPFGKCAEYISQLSSFEPAERLLPGGIKAIQKPGDPLKQDGRFEAHRKYIDIQLVLKGAELVKTAPAENAEILEAYSEAEDIEWLKPDEEYTVQLKPGRLLVLFPWDAHMPSLMVPGGTETTDKLIFKIPVELLKRL